MINLLWIVYDWAHWEMSEDGFRLGLVIIIEV
jgi:hypothetical protein